MKTLKRIWKYRRALQARLAGRRARIENQARAAMRDWLMV
jgi:hypothetical protein